MGKCQAIIDGVRCTKDAGYGEGKRSHCKEHKSEKMTNPRIGRDSRNCPHEDHIKDGKAVRSNFGYEADGKYVRCGRHKLDGMINLNNRNNKCKACKQKAPSYAVGDENGPIEYCAGCSKDICEEKGLQRYDRVSKLCEYDGCRTNATFGSVFGNATHCKEHKSDQMFDVKNSNCEVCKQNGKKTQPTFGVDKPTHCAEHQLDGMIDLRHDSVKCECCSKRASFGYEINKPMRCKDHILMTMFDVVSEKCIECKDKQPCFNLRGFKPKYCMDCKTEQMENVSSFKCISCNLFSVAKQGDRCKKYCQAFDAYSKRHEIRVKTLLEENKIPILCHDKIIDSRCNKYRPDFVIDCGTHMVIVEVDEDQHSSYEQDCEEARMIAIWQSFGGTPCVFIRYNPDNYKIKNADVIPVEFREKHIFLPELRKRMKKSPADTLSVIRVFYDSDKDDLITKYKFSEDAQNYIV
jgi:hypothetical protein